MVGKNHKQGNIERLNNYCLDIYNSAEEIAAALEISIDQLQFLAFNIKTSKVSHYIHFKTAKKCRKPDYFGSLT